MSTGRLEAFSDGVIAVAITLLALGLAVSSDHAGLADALVDGWPRYVAYAVSFLTIGIIWINHHAMIGRLRQADHSILALNLVLLMTVAALPFTTNLMATYLGKPGASLATGVYSGSFLAMSIAFAVLNRHILLARPHLLKAELPIESRRLILRRSVLGLLPYAIATALAVVSAYVTLGICAALAAYYAFPLASGGGRSA
ncbi:MAG: TMEM175 family protein [Solirubrobacteraceae bacterium]